MAKERPVAGLSFCRLCWVDGADYDVPVEKLVDRGGKFRPQLHRLLAFSVQEVDVMFT
jgi:hypothetical protein